MVLKGTYTIGISKFNAETKLHNNFKIQNMLKVSVTSVTQTGNKILGTEDKTLYYLIIGEGENKVVINVGLKTYESIKKLTTKEK